MKKIYLIASIAISVLLITIIISINLYEEYSFNGVEEIHSIKTNYTYNISDNHELEVLCYSNDPKSFIQEYSEVQATLVSGNYIIGATITNAKRVTSLNYKDERIYGYKLYIKPQGVSITEGLEDCILKTRDFEIEIGNLSIVSLKDKSTYLDFSKIYAIGNESLGFKSINGFVITFKNNSNTPISITNIFLGHFNFTDLSKAYKLDSDINYSEDITKYIPSYNPLSYSKNDASIVVDAKSSVKYLIPIYYSDKSFLGNTSMYINNSLYISNSNYITSYDNLDIYKGIVKNGKLNNS